MSPEEKLAAFKHAWMRQIVSVTGTGRDAEEIVRLAELNGLFDLNKAAYAEQDRAYQQKVDGK